MVAARSRVGATSLLIGAALGALDKGQRVAYFSERLRQEQIRGRFVVLESRVNGYRFQAGFVTAEDRIALAAARERIPWSALSLVTRRRILPGHIDGHLFSYRPLLVIADVQPRTLEDVPRSRDSIIEGLQRMASLARKHRVAFVVRSLLNRGRHPPEVLELPGVGRAAELFDSVVLLHRDVNGEPGAAGSAAAEARIVRSGGRDVEPRAVPLRFDQRFAGLLEA